MRIGRQAAGEKSRVVAARDSAYRYDEPIKAVADVQLMSSPVAARSIYESEPSTGSHIVVLGAPAEVTGRRDVPQPRVLCPRGGLSGYARNGARC